MTRPPRLNPDGTLPLDSRGIEETGFTRNWWVGLAMLHTLFVREHNAICDHLKAAYPHSKDAALFNVARLVNAAVMAKIHTVEWTPAILPHPALDKALNANWFGLLTNGLRKGKARKTAADINVRNPELGAMENEFVDTALEGAVSKCRSQPTAVPAKLADHALACGP